MKLPLLCLSALLCLPLAAQATMYKCTQPDGKSTFQDTPCPGGTVGTVANVTNVQTVSESPASDVYVGPPVPVAVGGGVYSSGAANSRYVNEQGVVVVRRDRFLEHREAELHREAEMHRRAEAARHAEQQRSSPLPPSSSNNTGRASVSRAPAVHAAAHAAGHAAAH